MKPKKPKRLWAQRDNDWNHEAYSISRQKLVLDAGYYMGKMNTRCVRAEIHRELWLLLFPTIGPLSPGQQIQIELGPDGRWRKCK